MGVVVSLTPSFQDLSVSFLGDVSQRTEVQKSEAFGEEGPRLTAKSH